jgi:hypothetical protein
MASWPLKNDESGVVVPYERGVATVVAALMTRIIQIGLTLVESSAYGGRLVGARDKIKLKSDLKLDQTFTYL